MEKFLPDPTRLGCPVLVTFEEIATCLTSPKLLSDKPVSKRTGARWQARLASLMLKGKSVAH